jgi:two-component system nitrogen regulation response regulator NtrX
MGILRQIAKVAPTNARVLILGESGTGKELIAQALHERSERRERPFVKVNCAAIPEELIEAELFGSEKGAYTGAVARREGKFQAADGGTLFLDEVGDMSLRVQTKVLRALQDGEIQRVGSDKLTRVDVRVIAATNKHLPEEVAAGRFREDLYYRLNVVPITSPPLRERVEDILVLAKTYLEEYCTANELPLKTLSAEVVERLQGYPWPGNVRELRNQVERMVIMCPGRVIQFEDLAAEIRAGIPSAIMSRRGERVVPAPEAELARTGAGGDANGTGGAAPGAQLYSGLPLQDARRQFEHDMIVQALEANNWNVSRTADELGLERTNLHKKMKMLGINRR